MKPNRLLAFVLVLAMSSALAQRGTLEQGDLELPTGEYLDLHDLVVVEPAQLHVSLNSSDFDPFLVILDEANEPVFEVDDSAGYGLQIDETVDLSVAGTYTVAVTSAFPGESGEYELSLELRTKMADRPAGSKAGSFELPDLIAPAAPRDGAAEQAVAPQSRIAPRAGHITGTAFGTDGEPLAGAGVLITGTTYEQGQRTSFETVTGADGTFSVRVPDGRYEAKAWVDVEYGGRLFSRLLHPLSGRPGYEVDSTVGGNIDFQWRLSGLTAYSTPPGTDATDFYGASIDFNYCGLPATAYCTISGDGVPTTPIAPGGSLVTVTLTPTGPLIDGSPGDTIEYQFVMEEQDDQYPYGSGVIPGYPDGGGGRLVLGQDWEYHSDSLFDIPLGSYRMSAVVTLPDGSSQPLRLGLADDDVNYGTVPVNFEPWEDYNARSYIGGGLTELTVYVRD